MFHQVAHHEVGRAFHHRIVLTQERLVARIEVVLPEMLAKPCAAVGPHPPGCAIDWTGNTPKVGVVVSHPTLGTIKSAGRLVPGDTEVFEHGEERFMAFGEVGYLSRPIVHFGIDVDGVLAVPRCVKATAPDTLQISRLTTWLRGADEQVASVLVEQGHQVAIIDTVEVGHALISGSQ